MDGDRSITIPQSGFDLIGMHATDAAQIDSRIAADAPGQLTPLGCHYAHRLASAEIALNVDYALGQQAGAFYAVHQGRPFYDELVEFMTSGPSYNFV